jgi:hypothetical protein
LVPFPPPKKIDSLDIKKKRGISDKTLNYHYTYLTETEHKSIEEYLVTSCNERKL